LRETVRRKRKRLERDGRLVFSCLLLPEDMAAGMAAYETVYAASWKPPEPHPAFMPALAQALAREGTFRLGLAHIDGAPAAAQIWLVRDRRATIFKLAHAPAFDTHSPGTILTHWLLSELCGRGEISELDLGRGDDAYKRLWLGESDFRSGILACNPARFTGLYHIMRDIWPTRAHALLRRGRGSEA
jgi:CelD/BcsL family acetyltransferase involved in cellulose biosynthesis